MTNEEAIKMLKSKMDGNTDTSYEWAETVRMAIKALEQEQKTEWIPVSEKLPEPSGRHRYLVTEAHFNPEYKARFVHVCEYEARYDAVPPYWVGYGGDNPARVVAWMPLPQPYKVESEG